VAGENCLTTAQRIASRRKVSGGISELPTRIPNFLLRLLRAKIRMYGASPRPVGAVSGASEPRFRRPLARIVGSRKPSLFHLPFTFFTRRTIVRPALLRDTDLADHRDRLPDSWASLGGHLRRFSATLPARSPARCGSARGPRLGTSHVPHCFLSAATPQSHEAQFGEAARVDAR